jgi:hypothetical protein
MVRLGITVALAVGLAGPAFAEPIGMVKTASGDAAIMRDGSKLVAAPGLPLERKDQVVTGADGQLGFTLKDDTTISVGPKTVMGLEEFDFQPAADKLGLVASLSRGTMLMTTGAIAKLSPDKVSVQTKTGTIGVRGTRFLVNVDE